MEGKLMKTVGIILKILAALAVIAGIVYVVLVYGDKIAAWIKKVLGFCQRQCQCDCDADCDACPCEDDCDDCDCVCDCDGCREEVVQADEADFEG